MPYRVRDDDGIVLVHVLDNGCDFGAGGFVFLFAVGTAVRIVGDVFVGVRDFAVISNKVASRYSAAYSASGLVLPVLEK